MSKKAKPPQPKKLLLTDRSLSDIAAIENYSLQAWDKKTAVKYISQIEHSLTLIQENPDLLWQEAEFHKCLQFYRINKHLLVFDVQTDSLILLTVFHGSMDIPSRLAELQSTFSKEVKLLHQQLKNK